jgi:hypothetical protein
MVVKHQHYYQRYILRFSPHDEKPQFLLFILNPFHRQEHIQGHAWDGFFFAEIYDESMVQYQSASANVQQYDKVLLIVSPE